MGYDTQLNAVGNLSDVLQIITVNYVWGDGAISSQKLLLWAAEEETAQVEGVAGTLIPKPLEIFQLSQRLAQ